MTKEEKETLINDLCGRLPNGLICSIYREDDEGFGWRDAECKGYFQNNDSYEFYFEDVIAVDNIERLKPYLRPLSSMTKEEKKEWIHLREIVDKYIDGYHVVVDFYNKHHFDYRCLIEDELAIEAPEGMYEFSDNTIGNE